MKVLLALVLVALHGLACAQSYPSKPVRLIIPFVAQETEKWTRVVKEAGIKPE
jgi:hypothetical protein